MDNLFLILALLSLIAIPVGLIKPKLLKMKGRLKALVLTVGATFVFFILFGITADVETETEEAVDDIENVEVEENQEETETEETVEETPDEEVDTEPEPEPEEDVVQEEVEVEAEPEEDDVPREHRNALQSAQNYIDTMPFSEKGLFEQLTSEYGEQYPEDAGQYAIENVEVDYNEEALESAENYQELMPMSDQELLDQLTSEYGEQFTEEQAQYALDNLSD
ncbi:Ltp family lipoprotein [Virgibacillus ainsalahensis]